MKRLNLFCALFSSLLAVVVFAFGVTRGHISMDDWGYIYGCPFVKGGLTLDNIVNSFTQFGYDAFWMPLTFITYMADITLLGGGWVVHHTVNLLLHAINVALAYLLLSKVLKSFFPSLDAGKIAVCSSVAVLFWALHPMRAETVVYIAARKDLLWSLFAISSLIFWESSIREFSRSRYCAALLCMVFACLSKPTAVALPFVAFAFEWALSARFPRRLKRYLPMLVISVAVGLITLYCQSNPMDHEKLDVFGESFSWRLLNALVSLGMYAWHTLWPLSIRFDYRAVFGGWPVDGIFGLSAFFILSALGIFAFVKSSSRSRNVICLSAAWAFFSLGPVLGVLGTVNGDHAYADRYTYFPSLAVSLLVAFSLAHISSREKVFHFSCALFSLYSIALVPVCISSIRSYRNDFTAFSRTLEKDPDHWRALRVVGLEYCARLGRMDEGIEMLKRSLSLRPSQKTAESLSYVLSLRGAKGDFEEVKTLAAAIRKNPILDKTGFMLEALGITALSEGDDASAIRFFSAALKVPERAHSDSHAKLYLGYALSNAGRKKEALAVLDSLRVVSGGDIRFKAAAAARLIRGGSAKRLEVRNGFVNAVNAPYGAESRKRISELD